MKNMSFIVRYVFTTPWWPANRLVWYNAIILSMRVSGMANTDASLSGVVTNLNIRESSKTKLSASVMTFFIVDLLLGNLFCVRNSYRSLK